MFRPNLFRVSRNRLIPLYRSLCSPSQPDKCYIIKTRDEGKKVVYESQIMQKFRNQQNGIVKVETSWENLIQLVRELLEKGQRKAVIIIRNLKIEEKLLKIKRVQDENLRNKITNLKAQLEPEKLKELPERLKNQFKLVQASEGYKKALNIPETISHFSRTSYVRVHHYWSIFLQSEAKKKLETIILWLWNNGKIVTLRVIKFVREAYFEKSDVKALPKP
jgi:flagellin-specific chaperone FliS